MRDNEKQRKRKDQEKCSSFPDDVDPNTLS